MDSDIKNPQADNKTGRLQEIKKFALVLFVGLFLSYFVRQPILPYCGISPESILELSIARNMMDGKGPLLSIKTTYENDLPVIHPAFGERGILYPAALSFFLKKKWEPQWLNIILSFLCALIFFYTVRKILDERTAWISFILLLFFPKLNLAASYMWNSIFLLFLLMLSVMFLSIKNRWVAFILAGLTAGSAIWADLWGIFFILAFIPGLLLSEKNIKASVLNMVLFSTAYAVALIPPLLTIKSIQGSYIPSVMPPFFQVQDYSSYVWISYKYQLPGIGNFVKINQGFIKGCIVNNLKIYSAFIASRQGLYLLPLCIIPLLFTLKSVWRKLPSRWMPVLSFSVFAFIGSCLFWSDREFTKMPVYLFIGFVPIIIFFLCKIEIKQFPAGLLTAVLLTLLTINTYTGVNYNMNKNIIETHNYRNLESARDDYAGWVIAQGGKNELYAALNPWTLYLHCNAPCGLIPPNISVENFREFQRKFSYNYFIANEHGENGTKLNEKMGNENMEWVIELIPGLWRVQIY